MSSNFLAAGIFAQESGQRLLHILLKLGDRGFRGLYEKCGQATASSYYKTGLKRVAVWSDDVIQEDIDAVARECPDMIETYEACFAQYVLDRFRGSKRPTHHCPSIISFSRNYLECLGQHDALASGAYFGSDIITPRIASMDAARQALYTLVTNESVRVELASEVGSVRPSARPREIEVSPDDSISQVGISDRRASRREPPPSPPRSTASRREPPPSPPRRERDTSPRSAISGHRPSPPSEPRSRRSEHRHSDDQERYASPAPRREDEELSVVSRHDFELVEKPRTPPRKLLAATSKASSRDSSVSIGMKSIKSPRH